MRRQILIAGDSTVTNRESSQLIDSGVCYTGWGQMLPLHLGPDYRIINFAKSGLTTDTFREKGHYKALLSHITSGDYVLFQFGHNDQKRPELQHNIRFRENLLKYIEEIKALQGIPILITPLARNTWNGSTGEYNDLLIDYANSTLDVAKESNTLFIDLHQISKNWILEQGREEVKPFFYPGDYTHSNDHGAFKFAGFVAKQLLPMLEFKKKETIWTTFCPSKIPQFLRDDSEKNLTREEALRTVREFCSFFAKNEIIPSNQNPELIAARQNGYLLFEDHLEKHISENDFVSILTLGTSGREKLPDDLFPQSNDLHSTITREKAISYLELYEDRLNYKKEFNKLEIAGS